MKEKHITFDQPLVSVLMSTYNGKKYIDRCLCSIVKQSLKNIEIICCDDCSTDNTYDKLLEWKNKDKRIIVLRNESNLRLAGSLNRCIKIARGKYIARIDDDDYMDENRLKQQYDFLELHPEYAILGTNAFLFDEKGCYEERKTIEKPQKRDFLLDNCFLHPTTMIRIEALVAVCGYTESTKTFPEDYDLWTRMYAYGYKGFNIQQALTYYYKNRLIHSKYGFKHHLISVKIRYESFKRLGLMPIGYLFIMKPLLLPFLPLSLINRMKKLKR